MYSTFLIRPTEEDVRIAREEYLTDDERAWLEHMPACRKYKSTDMKVFKVSRRLCILRMMREELKELRKAGEPEFAEDVCPCCREGTLQAHKDRISALEEECEKVTFQLEELKRLERGESHVE